MQGPYSQVSSWPMLSFTMHGKFPLPLISQTKGKSLEYWVCKSLVAVHICELPRYLAKAIATGLLPKPVGASKKICLNPDFKACSISDSVFCCLSLIAESGK